MTFTAEQTKKLASQLRRQFVKQRAVDGKTLNYLEGWHVISEANRIFGFDGWDRETISNECIWRTPVEGGFGASYLTRVRVRVRAGDSIVVREGLGSGESIAPTPGQAHEMASKAAETDATKRALSTFGNSFGLSLYGGKMQPNASDGPRQNDGAATAKQEPPRPPAATPGIAHLPVHLPPAEWPNEAHQKIDKSALTISEPKRSRDRDHLRFVASQACVVCGRNPSQAHHLRFAQPRALGRKVSDEFTVPLCAIHHQELHHHGNETAWWEKRNLDPLPLAETLWRQTRFGESPTEPEKQQATAQ